MNANFVTTKYGENRRVVLLAVVAAEISWSIGLGGEWSNSPVWTGPNPTADLPCSLPPKPILTALMPLLLPGNGGIL